MKWLILNEAGFRRLRFLLVEKKKKKKGKKELGGVELLGEATPVCTRIFKFVTPVSFDFLSQVESLNMEITWISEMIHNTIYPAGASSELLPEDRGTDYAPPGTLPPNAENISSAAKDLLKRLLQPDPCLRLRSLLSLQRIAFYMGYDLQSYMQKKDTARYPSTRGHHTAPSPITAPHCSTSTHCNCHGLWNLQPKQNTNMLLGFLSKNSGLTLLEKCIEEFPIVDFALQTDYTDIVFHPRFIVLPGRWKNRARTQGIDASLLQIFGTCCHQCKTYLLRKKITLNVICYLDYKLKFQTYVLRREYKQLAFCERCSCRVNDVHM
ncbi:hypothetical protein WN51_01608 [Melipona quadrifasciata]|uniref:Uncharacterized protein n=1 Tax=Melipona quadrifasciata TaxID=166423 RepID=A0A0M8ZUD7_9HYME|nr:hypothetical protein WN51_01608 [Melipona quadrifasciata]